jgi:hypothetical protein
MSRAKQHLQCFPKTPLKTAKVSLHLSSHVPRREAAWSKVLAYSFTSVSSVAGLALTDMACVCALAS